MLLVHITTDSLSAKKSPRRTKYKTQQVGSKAAGDSVRCTLPNEGGREGRWGGG